MNLWYNRLVHHGYMILQWQKSIAKIWQRARVQSINPVFIVGIIIKNICYLFWGSQGQIILIKNLFQLFCLGLLFPQPVLLDHVGMLLSKKLLGVILITSVWGNPEDCVQIWKWPGDKLEWRTNVAKIGAEYWRQRGYYVIGNIYICVSLARCWILINLILIDVSKIYRCIDLGRRQLYKLAKYYLVYFRVTWTFSISTIPRRGEL